MDPHTKQQLINRLEEAEALNQELQDEKDHLIETNKRLREKVANVYSSLD